MENITEVQQGIKEILDARTQAYSVVVNAIQKTQQQLQQLIAEQLRIEGELRLLQNILKKE